MDLFLDLWEYLLQCLDATSSKLNLSSLTPFVFPHALISVTVTHVLTAIHSGMISSCSEYCAVPPKPCLSLLHQVVGVLVANDLAQSLFRSYT